MDLTVRTWLERSGGEKFLSISDNELSVLTIAAPHPDIESPPDDVLLAWHRSLAGARTTWRQSEAAFIRAAIEAGWTADRLREVLGLPDDLDPADHLTELERQLVEQHPSRNATPWTGGRWVNGSAG